MEKTNLPVALPLGFTDVAAASGYMIEIRSDGVYASNKTAVEALYVGYSGSAAELTYYKTQKQADLDTFFNAHFDLAAFIRDGTATNVTATNVGNFLATITNNYRSKRASISAAANVAAVTAISVSTGWPANP